MRGKPRIKPDSACLRIAEWAVGFLQSQWPIPSQQGSELAPLDGFLAVGGRGEHVGKFPLERHGLAIFGNTPGGILDLGGRHDRHLAGRETQ